MAYVRVIPSEVLIFYTSTGKPGDMPHPDGRFGDVGCWAHPAKVDRAAVFGSCSSFDFGGTSTEFHLLLVGTSKCCVGIYSKGITNPYDFSF